MKKTTSVICGLLGLSFVIMIHEFGHFLAAKLFGVAVPLFSIGFGPALFGVRIGGTLFQLALFPIGGYVAIAPKQLAEQPYLIKLIILSAGIFANFLFAYILLLFFRFRKINVRALMMEATGQSNDSVVGPIGIISIISHSAALGLTYYLLVLAALSMGIGMFNLLPIPFFDGGQIAWYTIEALFGKIPESVSNASSTLFFLLFILFILFITFRDVRRFRG